MIRILTSLVALFTVTSVQTQAALTQFSKLLTNVVGEQTTSSRASSHVKNILSKEICQQLIKKKISSEKKKSNYLFWDSLFNKRNWLITNKIIFYFICNQLYTSSEKNIFHIRSPNQIPL